MVMHTMVFPCSDLGRVADLQQVILGTFSSQSEEVRSAASYALGKSQYDVAPGCVSCVLLCRQCQCWQSAEVPSLHSLRDPGKPEETIPSSPLAEGSHHLSLRHS